MRVADILIVGAGIVGLATATRLLAHESTLSVTILEKERQPARHQTGRNSGVLHSGIYYTPGSSKAENCRRGRAMMEEFCDAHGVRWERCGKLIVAADEQEKVALLRIAEHGRRNRVDNALLDAKQLRDVEPHASGVAALHVPSTGIVDYGEVAQVMAERLRDRGVSIELSTAARGVERGATTSVVRTADDSYEASAVINCGGLHADRIARMAGDDPGLRIVPFRGEYYRLREGREHLCRALIYPVPDPRLPFLGVHLTREVSGGVTCGPNAVLALAREGYSWREASLRDLAETLTWPGFRKLAAAHVGYGLSELWRSWSKHAFARSLQKLVPEVRATDLVAATSGVRAQAVRRDGTLVDDFVLRGDRRVFHVCNAPSPAATSALSIGDEIAGRVLDGA